MTRDDVCQEFGAWYRGQVPEEVHWSAAEAMADEIVRLRATLAALREPSGRVVRRMTQRTIEGLHRVDLDIVLDAIRVALPVAVEAAEQEASA